MSRTDPVLIVGAGPTGLSLACALLRHGAACRVIDRAAGPTPPHESRALAVWERTPSFRWEGPRLIDGHGRLHRRFGAASPCLYLIRPDRHVGYRAQPPDAARLAAYLGRLFG
jgi:glycine/D-amino acid oxidase-like deaminating enzyme